MENLAKMAMLDENDAKRLWGDVEKLLAMAKVLEELEVTAVPDCKSGTLREDDANEPCAESGYIIVPKVVGE